MKIKSFLQKNWLKILIPVCAVILLVLISILILNLRKEENTLTTEKADVYMYFSDRLFEYKGELKIDKNDNVYEIDFGNAKVNIDSIPVYYKNEKKVLFSKQMAIVYPNEPGFMYNSLNFSFIEEVKEVMHLQNRHVDKNLSNCFLYDGIDSYFFIEKTTIKYGDKEIELTPFSHAVMKQDKLEIYDYEANNYKIYEVPNQTVYAFAEGYRIDLKIDAIKTDSKELLLIKDIKGLQTLK